jgi:cytochrome c-type biogenesis protein CcmH
MTGFLLPVAIIIGLVLLPVMLAARNAFGRAAKHDTSPESETLKARRDDNIQSYKQHLAALDAQLASAEIAPATHTQLVGEAKQQLLQDAQSVNGERQSKAGLLQLKRDRIMVFALVLAMPLGALFLYLPSGISLGNIDQLLVVEKMANLAGNDNREQALNALIATAERQTKTAYADPQLLHLLASIYRSLGRYDDAMRNLERMLKKQENAETLALLVETQYMQQLRQLRQRQDQGGQQDNNNEQLLFTPLMQHRLERALQLNPNQPDALSLSGINAFRAGRYLEAVEYWQKALAGYPPMSAEARTLQDSIRVALQHSGSVAGDLQVVSAKALIKLHVSIDEALLTASDAPSTPVFVFARPVSGPRMPLAAKRLTLAELPLDIVLTNNDAMAGRSLADVGEVIVGARLARSGQPTASAGDLESATHTMPVNKLGENGIESFDEATLSALQSIELRIEN